MHSYRPQVFIIQFKNTHIIGFSVVTIEFPEDQDKYIGWAEAAIGIGLVLGPVLGSFLFNFVGYTITFLVFGALLLIGAIMIQVLLPSRVNYTQEKTSEETMDSEEEDKEVRYSMFLKNFRCLVTLVGCTIIQLFGNF